jgi:hypothetical protein
MHAATESHLLEAAHALQALLLLDGESESLISEGVGEFSAVADAMLKAFNAVAAAPLTHPLLNGKDWGESPVERVTEPISAFVQAVLCHAGDPQVLLDVGALRCGVPVNMDVDAGNAWWCNPPLLMQADASCGDAVGAALHTSASRAAPRRRYICNGPSATPMQPNFAWPAHHYSSILQKWSSLAMLPAHTIQVQALGIASTAGCLSRTASAGPAVPTLPFAVSFFGDAAHGAAVFYGQCDSVTPSIVERKRSTASGRLSRCFGLPGTSSPSLIVFL